MASYPQRIEALLRNPHRGTTRPLPHTAAGVPLPALAVRLLDDGRELLLDRELAIGRAPGNDLTLADGAVSARHCLVLHEPRGPTLYDCRSTNGTFLNWVRVERAELAEGALIVVGNSHLRVVAARPAGATAPGTGALAGIIGRSKRLRAALADVKRVARSHLSVLVLGESGTGKELVARAVHALSARADGPFVAVNCSAIPHEVAESELFGHERGAFTGAVTARPGVFEEATGGTLLLDEVGDLPPPLQPKLLRALETRTVRRVGGRADVRVDVRVVAATNRELGAGTSAFRADLYHRLAAVVVRLPALRERPEDIGPLVEHFLTELSAEHGARVLAPEALRALRALPWPGNVRELRNAIERAVVLAGGPVLTAQDLVARAPLGAAPRPPELDPGAPEDLIRGRTLGEIEREAIDEALRRTCGNQRAAALLLGLPRTTLADRARRYGLLRSRDPS